MFQHVNNNQSINKKGSSAAQTTAMNNLTSTADRQKKYNTIDTNVQAIAVQGTPVNPTHLISNAIVQSPAPNSGALSYGISPIIGLVAPGATQETAGTSNPSNDINCNSEFIDIMRKVPRILCERYELLDVLGKGAHGRIYLATDLVTLDKVAIKLMEKSSKNKSKFQREISLMKDMMKLAKKKPLKENCINYQDPETVQLNAKLQQQQQLTKQGSTSQISTPKNRRIGFPRLYSYCSDQNYYYLVMQLLGVNLKELKESFKECKFSIQTVIIIALQLLNRLNSIHSQGYIHRDLKPANVVIGNDSNEAHFIYLIDFGLAKKENSTNPPIEVSKSGKNGQVAVGPAEEEPINIIDPKTGKKKTAMQTLQEYLVEEQDNFRVVGTAMYAALAAHLPNKKYLKKDDIESLFFLLSYFGVGQLPWRYKTNQEGLEKMMQYKFEIKPKDLFPPEVFPPQFARLFEYIRYIPDDQEADFAYMERELLQSAQQIKIDPSLLIALDWMNYRPIVAQQLLQQQQLQQKGQQQNQAHSPQPQSKGSRQVNNSQMSKNSNGVPGLKTPLHSDKITKKQPFTMTPDIHTKTYAERSGLGGIATGFGPVNGINGVNAIGQAILNNTQNQGYRVDQQMTYGNIHKSAKNKNQQHFVGLVVGGAGLGANTSNMAMVAQGNAEHESIRGANNNEGSIENERAGEDIQMMNIPAEGNADHLNKSTKLTLSSKKQYDNHLQNISITQHLNNSQTGALIAGGQFTQVNNNQFMLAQNSQGIVSQINNLNGQNITATRSKMNSTMMVKFNSSTEKNIGAPGTRTNLNKSTLLPSNIVGSSANRCVETTNNTINNQGNLGITRTSNSTTVANKGGQLKLNPNIIGNNGISAAIVGNQTDTQNLFDQNLQQNSFDHMNRSLNMHQIQAAFSQNHSFQQSPPNVRNNKQMGGVVIANQQPANSSTHNKFNNLFDKNKASALNIKIANGGTQGLKMVVGGQGQVNQVAAYMSGIQSSNMQTIQNGSALGQQNSKDNNFQLPHAPGAQGASTSLQNAKTSWNNPQNIGQQNLANLKNKDRYMHLQQQQQMNQSQIQQTLMMMPNQNQNGVTNNVGMTFQQKQFFISQQNHLGNQAQNSGTQNQVNQMNVYTAEVQNQIALMNQQPLSPTGTALGLSGQQYNVNNNFYGTTAGNSNVILGSQNQNGNNMIIGNFSAGQQGKKQNYNNYKNMKMINQPQQQQFVQNKSNQSSAGPGNVAGNQSQFGSRLSNNTNMSGNTPTPQIKRATINQGASQSAQQNKQILHMNMSHIAGGAAGEGPTLVVNQNNQNMHNLSQLAMSPMKGNGGLIGQQGVQVQGSVSVGASQQNNNSLIQQQQASRQSKNSSALGMIGGSIISNNNPVTGSQIVGLTSGASQQLEPNGSQGNIGGNSPNQNPFNMNRQNPLNKSGMMYNTMYSSGGVNISQNQQAFQSQVQITGQQTNGSSGPGTTRPSIIGQKIGNQNIGNATSNPIHIKIEDQTGVLNSTLGGFTGKQGGGAYTMNAVSPNPHSSNKKQFQQTGQKFNSVIKAQQMMPGSGLKSAGPGSTISAKKGNGPIIGLQTGFNRNKSKSGLNATGPANVGVNTNQANQTSNFNPSRQSTHNDEQLPYQQQNEQENNIVAQNRSQTLQWN